MKLFEVAIGYSNNLKPMLEVGYPNILISYWFITKGSLKKHMEDLATCCFFLDSGAHTANTKGVEIDLYEYIDFINKWSHVIDFYAGLDSIKSHKETRANQKIMEDAGLKPLITYHYGEPPELLEEYLQHYHHICIGGVVGKSRKLKVVWLDALYAKVISRYPDRKVHLFGIHDRVILERYPAYSADASSSGLQAGMGVYSLNGANVHWSDLKDHRTLKSYQLAQNELAQGLGRTEIAAGRLKSFLREKLKFQEYVTNLWKERGIEWTD